MLSHYFTRQACSRRVTNMTEVYDGTTLAALKQLAI